VLISSPYSRYVPIYFSLLIAHCFRRILCLSSLLCFKTFQMKHRERVLGLILVSPLCKAPSWSEWFYNKVITNLLYYYGMCGVVKEFLLQRYFSKVCSLQLPLLSLCTCCISRLLLFKPVATACYRKSVVTLRFQSQI